MTTFEFVFALYSIIISLGLTHLLAGFVDLRRAAKVRVSGTHLLWAGTAFTISIGNWATMWQLRAVGNWPSWMVLMMLTTALGQYVFCVFVTPDTKPGGTVDLVDFHNREYRRYTGMFLALCVISQAFNITFGMTGYYGDWSRDVVLSLPGIVAGLVAFFVPGKRVQLLAAAVLFAIGVYFLTMAAALSA